MRLSPCRLAFSVSLILLLVATPNAHQVAGAEPDSDGDVRSALAGFLSAFDNLDLDRMRLFFADEITAFPRVFMTTKGTPKIDLSQYHRQQGADMVIAGFRQFADGLRKEQPGPPYMHLEPQDLDVRVFGEAAVISFHLMGQGTLSRRTFVLAKRNGAWKIVHIHASNVDANAE